jgi:enamine deaminase RidA (YjgF/YER057c/UK114 family)
LSEQEHIFTGKAWERSAPHSPGRIAHGSLLLTSGITARDADGKLVAPNDMLGQCRKVVSNLFDVMRAAGTNERRILKLSVFVTSIDEYLAAKEVWKILYVNRPASTLVEVRRLQMPEMVVEVEAVVELPS